VNCRSATIGLRCDQFRIVLEIADRGDREANRSGYSASDDKVEPTLSRLLGRHWQDAWKLGKLAPEPNARTASSYLLSDPSVGIVFSRASSADDAGDFSDF
jgi:hypothetical protein